MLGTKARSKQKEQPIIQSSTPSGSPSGATTVVDKGTKLEGNFKSKDNVRMDGEIVGEVVCEKRLVMGKTGKISGKVKVQEAIIEGYIEGEITVKSTLHLKSTANIKGTILSKYLVVDEGAVYNGECKVGENHTLK
ncbi:MAG: polymer-forming cytoskeletal protein [Bacteroidetes bacterium]|nr:polymer-forming cytoskeletal protein [Bacteroidota bacterium]